jgi:hypothetical protein
MPKGDRLIVSGPPPPQTDTPSPSAFGYDPETHTYDWEETRKAQTDEIKARREGAAAQERDEQRALRESAEGRASVTEAMAQRRRDAAAYPEQRKPPDPPNPEDYQKLSWGYLGSMVALGAFAGLAIRNAGNAPLNAFAGAAKGWNEGNMTAYKNATAEWEQKNRQLQEINRQQLEKYRTIMQNDNLGIDDQMNMMQMAAAENKDRIMYDQSKAKNFNGIAQALAMREQTTRQFMDNSQKIADLVTQQNESAQSNADQVRNFLNTPQGQQWFKQFNPSQQMQIKGFLETYPAAQAPEMQTEEPRTVGAGAMQTQGQQRPRLQPGLQGPPPPNMKPADRAARSFEIEQSMKSQGYTQEQINEHLASTGQQSSRAWAGFNLQQHPIRALAGADVQAEDESRAARGLPPMDANERLAFQERRNFGLRAAGTAGSRAGGIEVAVQQFAAALPIASAASAAVPRGKFTPINNLRQDAALMRSEVAYGNFVAANEYAITEYAAAISRGGVMTQHAQERAAKVLNTATSNEAYQARLQQLQKEVNAASTAGGRALAVILRQAFPKASDDEIEEEVAASGPPIAAAPQAPAGAGPPATPADDGFGQNVRVR